MSQSGGGQGTPLPPSIVPVIVYDQMEELSYIPNCAVSLPRYAKLIGYEEAAFWGVRYENQLLRGCDPLWTEHQRFSIAQALAEAQQEMEQLVNYPLCPTWIAGTVSDEVDHNDRWVDQQCYKYGLLTRYPRIIAAGVRAETMIEAGSDVDHGQTVGVIGPLATTATSTEEIHIYYPDSNREIIPSKITIDNGQVTIEIPRYRLVTQDKINNAVDYEVLENFLDTVDVKRIYNDPSVNAILVRPHCKNNNCYGGCNECTQSACIYIRDPYIGYVDVGPANWNTDTETWDSRVLCGGLYKTVRLNYLAGMRYLNLQAELAIVRLAHSKMGRPPCQCDRTGEMWKNDYESPTIMTRERLNCPFGLSNGAWLAYRWAMSLISRRAAIL